MHHQRTVNRAAIYKLAKQIKEILIDSPSGYIFGIFAITRTFRITNFEYCTNWTAVLSGNTLQTDVIFSTVVGMGVTWKRARVARFTWGGARETARNFCNERREQKKWDRIENCLVSNNLRFCIRVLDRPTCKLWLHGRRLDLGSTDNGRLRRSNSSRRRRILIRPGKYRRDVRNGAWKLVVL